MKDIEREINRAGNCPQCGIRDVPPRPKQPGRKLKKKKQPTEGRREGRRAKSGGPVHPVRQGPESALHRRLSRLRGQIQPDQKAR